MKRIGPKTEPNQAKGKQKTALEHDMTADLTDGEKRLNDSCITTWNLDWNEIEMTGEAETDSQGQKVKLSHIFCRKSVPQSAYSCVRKRC